MSDYPAWFTNFKQSKHYQVLQQKPLAYFCIEYALSDSLPTFAGGLGVLAGDYVRELFDQRLPAVAVGLYYHSKYGVADQVHEASVQHLGVVNPEEQGLLPVLDSEKKPLLIKIPLADHDILIKVWVWDNKTIPVYLLDTNVEENNPVDRAICYKLYDGNKETRLRQEMVLGIGGFRLLEKLGISPSLYHLNEGHSALLYLELIRHEMHKHKISFQEALGLVGHHVVFTNHTLLPAGNEVFSNDLFTYTLGRYASELEIPLSEIITLGEIPGSSSFSFSLLALKLAGKINAVSKLHATEAMKTWVNYKVESITNGIHLATWDHAQNTTSLRAAHTENKRKLLEVVNKQTGLGWNENELLLGWARRIVRYKRPLAIFGEIERFIDLVKDEKRPIRLIMSGFAHQRDSEGKALMQAIQSMIEKHLPTTAVYIPEYTMDLAGLMISGCDVWLNTPVVGFEACGTSGMKACLNGVLPCSTNDGWVAEVNLSEMGWMLNNEAIHDSIIEVLEEKIVPLYYENDKKWEEYMKNARQLIKNEFSTTRMVKEYFEKAYIPILTTSYTHYFPIDKT